VNKPRWSFAALSETYPNGFWVLAVFILFAGFAWLTDGHSYGISHTEKLEQKWFINRLGIMAVWLTCAGFILQVRMEASNWRGFIVGFATTGTVLLLMAPRLIPEGAQVIPLLGSIFFYSCVTGFLCSTMRSPVALVLTSLALVPVQLSVDGLVHIFTGIFRIH